MLKVPEWQNCGRCKSSWFVEQSVDKSAWISGGGWWQMTVAGSIPGARVEPCHAGTCTLEWLFWTWSAAESVANEDIVGQMSYALTFWFLQQDERQHSGWLAACSAVEYWHQQVDCYSRQADGWEKHVQVSLLLLVYELLSEMFYVIWRT